MIWSFYSHYVISQFLLSTMKRRDQPKPTNDTVDHCKFLGHPGGGIKYGSVKTDVSNMGEWKHNKTLGNLINDRVYMNAS